MIDIKSIQHMAVVVKSIKGLPITKPLGHFLRPY